MSSSKLLVTAAFLTAVCPSSRAVFIRAPSAVTTTSAFPSLSDLPPTTLGLLHHMSLGFPHSPHFAQAAAHVCDTRHLWAAALSNGREAADLVLHLLEAGRWNTTWGGGTAGREGRPTRRRGRNPKARHSVLAGQQAGSGAVVGAAILARLEGAPQELAAVEPDFLQDDENVLLAGIWQDWFDWHNLPDAARGSVNVMREFFRVAAEEMEKAQKAEDRSGLAAFDTDQSGLVRVPRKGPMRVMNSLKSLIAETRTVALQDLDWADLVGPPVEEDVGVVKQVLRTNQFLQVFETWDDLPLAAKLDVDCVVEAMRTGLLTKGMLAAYRFGSEVRASWWGFFVWLEELHALDAAPDVATSARAVATALQLGVLTFWSQVPQALRGDVSVVTAFLERQMNSDDGWFLERYGEFDFFCDVREPAATDEDVLAKQRQVKAYFVRQ
eukprot:g7737.t1